MPARASLLALCLLLPAAGADADSVLLGLCRRGGWRGGEKISARVLTPRIRMNKMVTDAGK